MVLHKNIRVLSWFNFFTDFILYAPVAILYFSRVSGSFALGMSVFSIAMVSSAIFEVPTGVFSDRIGRKNTVVMGSLAALISMVLYAIGGSYWMLVLGGIFEGLGRSFFTGNNDALLHDTLSFTGKVHEFADHSGKLSSMFQFALAGSAVLGAIIANWSFAWVMWLSVLPKVIMVTLSLQLVDVPITRDKSGNVYAHLAESFAQFRQNKKLQWLTIAAALRYALGESAYLFRSAFVATLWPVWAIGFSNLAGNLGAAISFQLSGKVMKKFTPIQVLNFEIISNRIVYFIALLFPSIVSPILMVTTSLTFGVGGVAMGTLLQKEFTPGQRATLGSLNSLLSSILFGVVAIALGAIGDIAGPIKTLLVAQILLLSPLIFYRQVFRYNKKEGEPFAILKSAPSQKRKRMMATAGSWKNIGLDDKIISQILTRTSRKNRIEL